LHSNCVPCSFSVSRVDHGSAEPAHVPVRMWLAGGLLFVEYHRIVSWPTVALLAGVVHR
jgi:hypothetical protein